MIISCTLFEIDSFKIVGVTYMKLKERFSRWMQGRYGNDQFNNFLLVVTIVCLVLSILFSGVLATIFNILTLAGLILVYYRMFSRNVYKRAAENNTYMNKTAGIRRSFGRLKSRSGDRQHRYFKCPQCKQTVRVPRGKGKINIRCPKCGNQFVKRT